MEQASQLWLFFMLVFGVVLLPGLDMAFVLASALAGGRRAGLAATAGIVAGGVCHVGMAAVGVVAVLWVVPAAFDALLLAGALYVGWIGWSLLRSRVALAAPDAARPVRTQVATFGQGVVTSLLNPKAYLFMAAVFPQFMRPEDAAPWRQALTLWTIIALTQTAVYGGMALAGNAVQVWLSTRPGASAWLARAVGTLLLATAAVTALRGLDG